jgi:hypothetical protein
VEIGFSSALAKLRFGHRIGEQSDGTLAYRVEDKSGHVSVTKDEWKDAGTFFVDSTRKSARQARLLLLVSLPAYVVYIAIANLVVSDELARALPYWFYFILFIGPLPGMPIAIYLRHSRHVLRVCQAIDATFAQRPRITAQPRAFFEPPFWFDLLCLLFIGPHLIVAVIGQLDPDIFRNTPFSGRHIDGKATVAFALLAVRLVWAVLLRRRTQAPHASR